MSYSKESCVSLNIYVDCDKKCDNHECVDINVYVDCDKNKKEDKHYKEDKYETEAYAE